MVVTVVGDDGGASGGGFAEHGGGCLLVTGEPGLPVVVARASALGEATLDVGLAVWVQPAAPATTTAAIAERRPGRNFRTDIEITVLKPGLFVFRAVTAAGRPDSSDKVRLMLRVQVFRDADWRAFDRAVRLPRRGSQPE